MSLLNKPTEATEPTEGLTDEYFEPEDGAEEIVVDFSKVGLVPPEGDYQVVVKSATVKPAKSSGNMMLALTLVVEDPEDFANVYVFDNLMLEGPGMARTKNAFIQILGDAVERFSPSQFVDERFWVHLVPEKDDQYGDRARVGYYGSR